MPNPFASMSPKERIAAVAVGGFAGLGLLWLATRKTTVPSTAAQPGAPTPVYAPGQDIPVYGNPMTDPSSFNITINPLMPTAGQTTDPSGGTGGSSAVPPVGSGAGGTDPTGLPGSPGFASEPPPPGDVGPQLMPAPAPPVYYPQPTLVPAVAPPMTTFGPGVFSTADPYGGHVLTVTQDAFGASPPPNAPPNDPGTMLNPIDPGPRLFSSGGAFAQEAPAVNTAAQVNALAGMLNRASSGLGRIQEGH